MGMTERLGLRQLTLVALAVVGCTSGTDVLLGHVPLAEDGGVDSAAGDAGASKGVTVACGPAFASQPAVEVSVCC